MQDISADESLSVAPRQLVSLMLEQSQTIRIACGRVWLTIEADVNDYWLSAGDTLALAAGRHIVIEADKSFNRIDVLPQTRFEPVGAGGIDRRATPEQTREQSARFDPA
jgi:hypothetical protein